MAITRLKYLTTNLIDDNTVLSVTGSWAKATNFPIENIYSKRVTNQAIFDTAKDGEIVIDLGSAKNVDTVFIFNHNFTSSVTLTIQGHTADSWGTPSISQSITYSVNDIYKEITLSSYRYWRLVVDDSTRSNNDIAIGEIVMGVQTELSKNFVWDITERKEYSNIDHVTNGGAIWSYNLYSRKSFGLSFVELTASQVSEIMTMFDDTYGGYYPLSIILESTAYFVRLTATFETTRPIAISNLESGFEINHPVEYTISAFEMIEESRGL